MRRMSAEEVSVSRSLARHPRWEWQHGMVACRDCAPHLRDFLWRELTYTGKRDLEFIDDTTIPDLTSASTLGAILGLIRELHQDRDMHPVLVDGSWCWRDGRGLALPLRSAPSYAASLYCGLDTTLTPKEAERE